MGWLPERLNSFVKKQNKKIGYGAQLNGTECEGLEMFLRAWLFKIIIIIFLNFFTFSWLNKHYLHYQKNIYIFNIYFYINNVSIFYLLKPSMNQVRVLSILHLFQNNTSKQ